MNELNRMQYLESIGIDSFVPKYILPAAKTAVLCPLPVVTETIAIGGIEKSSTLAFSGISEPHNLSGILDNSSDSSDFVDVSKVNELKDNLLRNDVLKNIDKTSNEISHNSINSEVSSAEIIEDLVLSARVEAAKFSLSLWNIGDDIFVIDSRGSGDALPTQGLLINILRAIGQLPANLINAEILNWPMGLMEGKHDTSWSAARQMVQGFIEARIFDKPTPVFLLFGKDTCSAVLGEEINFEENLYRQVSIETFSADAIILPSLADILYLPLSKVKVWQSLKSYNFAAGR